MKKASAKYRKAPNTTARKSWQEKTTNLNFERDGQKLWKLLKTLNGEYRQSPLVIEKDGDTLTGTATANALIAQNKVVADIKLSTKRELEINQAMQDNKNQVSEPIDSCLNIKLTMMEFEKALT